MDMKTKHKEIYDFMSIKPEKMRDKTLVHRDYPEMVPLIQAAMKDGCVKSDSVVYVWDYESPKKRRKR